MNTLSIISKETILNGSVAELLIELAGDKSKKYSSGGHLADFYDHIHDAHAQGVDNTEFVELHEELKSHIIKIKAGRKPNRKAILRLLQYGYLLAGTQIYSKEEEDIAA